MKKKAISCSNSGQIIDKLTVGNYWSNAFHTPFDTTQKIKNILGNYGLCEACIQEINRRKKPMNNSLQKDEILSLKKVISDTFEKRHSVSNFPLRIIYNKVSLSSNYPAQVLFTVPKKSYKLAVDRNRIRRRIKEAYRKNKHDLYQELENRNEQLALVIIYLGKKELTYQEIEKKLVVSLQEIILKL